VGGCVPCVRACVGVCVFHLRACVRAYLRACVGVCVSWWAFW
jgi:hypothetical protein